MAALLATASCSDSDSASKDFSNLSCVFQKANISGTNMLALASNAKGTRAGTSGNATISDPLFKVSSDGKLVSVQYTIDIQTKDKTDDQGNVIEPGFKETLKRDLQLTMSYIYPIGDKWLWLYDCALDQTGWDELPEGDEKGAIGYIIREHGFNVQYLVRRSDGAIFRWENAPKEILRPRGDYMSSEDICGLVEPMGNDIVYVNNNRVVTLLKASGTSLSETALSPADKKAMFVAPTSDGLIGTILTDASTIAAHNFYGTGEACALTTSGQKTTIGEYDRYGNDISGYQDTESNRNRIRNGKELFAAGGKLYYITRDANGNTANYDLVKINNGNVTFERKATLTHPNATDGYYPYQMHRGHTGMAYPVFKTETMSFIDGYETYTFDPTKPQLSIVPLPTHYARSPAAYYDGICYELSEDGSFPSKLWIGDQTKTVAEEVTINWSGVPQNIQGTLSKNDWFYWGGAQCFKAKATLTNGTPVTYVIYVAGSDKGKAKVIGENDGKEVHTLLKL